MSSDLAHIEMESAVKGPEINCVFRFALLSNVRSVVTKFLALGRRRPQKLRLSETLALGERRLVAVVEFEQARYLIGAASGSVSLLARLEDRERTGEK